MGNLLTAIDAEDTYRKVTKRVALKLAKCLASGTDNDILVAATLLPLLEKRVAYEHSKVLGRLSREFEPRGAFDLRSPF